MPDDLDTLPRIRRAAVLAFVAGLLAGAALMFLLRPDNRPSESLRKENQLLRKENLILRKLNRLLEQGSE